MPGLPRGFSEESNELLVFLEKRTVLSPTFWMPAKSQLLTPKQKGWKKFQSLCYVKVLLTSRPEIKYVN